jgi:hypothetical protein
VLFLPTNIGILFEDRIVALKDKNKYKLLRSNSQNKAIHPLLV